MGFFDFLTGGKKDKVDVTKAPSQVLRENGIDPSGLDFKFGSGGAVTVSGTVASAGEIDRVTDVLKGINGIESVNNQLSVRTAAMGDDNSSVGTVESSGGGDAMVDDNSIKTYTVVAGDTLWKIAKDHYGNGADYMKIFEANKDILDDPDKIQVGQTLKIPPK